MFNRNATVEPFGETVQQVFARISALRDSLDGSPTIDQGLVNTDPRTIAVPDQGVNLIPTDIQGITFNRSPQQVCIEKQFSIHCLYRQR